MSDPKGVVLPIYFVADESGSMADDIDELNAGLVSLLDTLQGEVMAAAKVRLCVIGFAHNAICYLEPSDLRDLESMPQLRARGSTSYAAAFEMLREKIPEDVSRLKGQGYQVARPAVFFLTDGLPNVGDQWEVALGLLVDAGFPMRPNILAFGIGDAQGDVIQHVATSSQYAFVTANGFDTGPAIAEFVKVLTQSVVSSGQALASGDAALQFEKPEGFISLAIDTL